MTPGTLRVRTIFMRYSFMRFLEQNPQQIPFLCCFSIALLVLPVYTFADTETMAEYTTCAVYHRMTVGAMRRAGNLDALADGEREKMNRFIDLAKEAGIEEYGEELSDEIFNDEWQAITAEMTDLINRNYDNVSKLKYLYRERCNRYL